MKHTRKPTVNDDLHIGNICFQNSTIQSLVSVSGREVLSIPFRDQACRDQTLENDNSKIKSRESTVLGLKKHLSFKLWQERRDGVSIDVQEIRLYH